MCAKRKQAGPCPDLLHNAALCYVADSQHRRSFEAPTQPGRSPSPGEPRGTKWRSQPRRVRLWPEPSLLCADGWCCERSFSIMGGKGASATGWAYSTVFGASSRFRGFLQKCIMKTIHSSALRSIQSRIINLVMRHDFFDLLQIAHAIYSFFALFLSWLPELPPLS